MTLVSSRKTKRKMSTEYFVRFQAKLSIEIVEDKLLFVHNDNEARSAFYGWQSQFAKLCAGMPTLVRKVTTVAEKNPRITLLS